MDPNGKSNFEDNVLIKAFKTPRKVKSSNDHLNNVLGSLNKSMPPAKITKEKLEEKRVSIFRKKKHSFSEEIVDTDLLLKEIEKEKDSKEKEQTKGNEEEHKKENEKEKVKEKEKEKIKEKEKGTESKEKRGSSDSQRRRRAKKSKTQNSSRTNSKRSSADNKSEIKSRGNSNLSTFLKSEKKKRRAKKSPKDILKREALRNNLILVNKSEQIFSLSRKEFYEIDLKNDESFGRISWPKKEAPGERNMVSLVKGGLLRLVLFILRLVYDSLSNMFNSEETISDAETITRQLSSGFAKRRRGKGKNRGSLRKQYTGYQKYIPQKVALSAFTVLRFFVLGILVVYLFVFSSDHGNFILHVLNSVLIITFLSCVESICAWCSKMTKNLLELSTNFYSKDLFYSDIESRLRKFCYYSKLSGREKESEGFEFRKREQYENMGWKMRNRFSELEIPAIREASAGVLKEFVFEYFKREFENVEKSEGAGIWSGRGGAEVHPAIRNPKMVVFRPDSKKYIYSHQNENSMEGDFSF